MKLACALMVYNEVESGHLARCLDSVVRYCDEVILYDDGSTDGTPEYAEELFRQVINCDNAAHHDQLSDYVIIRGTKNDFENELAHKQEQLEIAKARGVDWLLRLDADETLAENGVKKIRPMLELMPKDVPGVAFHTINLWRDPNFYRIDGGYNDVVFNRLWRITPSLHFDVQRGLHLTNYPVGATEGEAFAPYEIIHWGFSSPKYIVDKYRMYNAHGQTGWALDRLVDESTLKMKKSRDAWFDYKVDPADFKEVFAKPIRSFL